MTPPDWSDELAALFARVRAGDPGARTALFARLHDRLTRLAATVLRSFPGAARRHDLDSVVNDLYLGLVAALDEGHVPEDATGFMRLTAVKLRRLLLDEADRARVRSRVGPLDPGGESGRPADPGTTTYDPGRLADWTEFHRRVGGLPDDQRAVVELHLYLGLSQAEAAARLGLHPKAASRLWLAAAGALAPFVPGRR